MAVSWARGEGVTTPLPWLPWVPAQGATHLAEPNASYLCSLLITGT